MSSPRLTVGASAEITLRTMSAESMGSSCCSSSREQVSARDCPAAGGAGVSCLGKTDT
eukprot:CAMPEP_0168495800 /NCGR_PEP_ID=MMETSP0228-20121227/71934_1 /TAXON_ID=133427 /ORGANISM="Protoceratium reticulatum, Strain CCCM 535 (=CCMP 1889)" /LENGTH=57 /DNA_ID=CAMNT_0008512651 /DNA_START=90 /DNA_END=260 /DNA_ORIENTATION=-